MNSKKKTKWSVEKGDYQKDIHRDKSIFEKAKGKEIFQIFLLVISLFVLIFFIAYC